MSFETWWSLYYGAWDLYRHDSMTKGIARDAWEAAMTVMKEKLRDQQGDES